MNLYDAHTHLNHPDLYTQRAESLSSFSQYEGKGLVNIGANTEYNHNAIAIAQKAKTQFPHLTIKASIGIHPCDVENTSLDSEKEILLLKELYMKNKEHIVAIGECGIDLYYPGASDFLDFQKEIFMKQCELARELKLPIVIHSRVAFDETIEVLQAFKELKIYFHCWSYGVEQLETLLKSFPQIWIGYTGICTYPKSTENKACLQATPLDKILLETDAPYLAPQWFRGQINHPALVKVIGAHASSLLGLREEDLRNQIETNFNTLYFN